MKHTERCEKSKSARSNSENKILQHSQKVCISCHCGLVFCINIFIIFFMCFNSVMQIFILSRYFWHKMHDRKNPIKPLQRDHWFGYQLRRVGCCFYFLHFTSLLVIYLFTSCFPPYLRKKNIDFLS